MIPKELNAEVNKEIYYSDSKDVLGYIQNESRRFYIYVANRVQTIRNATETHQWRYIDTANNPADLANRCMSPDKLIESHWLSGPEFLWNALPQPHDAPQKISLDENDPEVKREVVVCTTKSQVPHNLGCSRLKRLSSWLSMQRAVANLIRIIKGFQERKHSKTPTRPLTSLSAAELEHTGQVTVKALQKEAFPVELKALTADGNKKTVPKDSNLLLLDPFLDPNGLIRVGGHLRNSSLTFQEKHPALLPKGHHLSELVIRHFHDKVHHQGRQITSGAVQEGGYWVIGAHRMIARLTESCVTCKRLRGQP